MTASAALARLELQGSSASVEPLRVMCISHSAISRIHGRLRYGSLLDRSDLRLDLVMPNRWSERGRWLTPDAPQADEDWVHALPIRWARAGSATWHLHHYVGLGRLMRRVQPQVIHLWQEPWSLVALQALRLRNRVCPHAALVLEVDQNLHKHLPAPFEQIRRTVLRQTGYVLARSDEAIQVVRACGYDGPAGRIGYGVDRSVFRPVDRAAERPAAAGLSVGYVGRFIEEKGVGDLIEAVSRTATPVNLAIMGEGPFQASLVAQAAALGVSDRLRILPWGSPEDVAAFMAGLDILALLTWTTDTVREQFGRVIIEAQACGTPVIGSGSGAIADVVGEGGWIVPEQSPAAVAALLDRLAARPVELKAAQAQAIQQVAERFSFTAQADVLEHAWRSPVYERQPA
jgi:glycosyltransferase involved in cell wall biosynthesis